MIMTFFKNASFLVLFVLAMMFVGLYSLAKKHPFTYWSDTIESLEVKLWGRNL